MRTQQGPQRGKDPTLATEVARFSPYQPPVYMFLSVIPLLTTEPALFILWWDHTMLISFLAEAGNAQKCTASVDLLRILVR